ncbi:MAG: DUF2461 family protein [Nannocystaceae bacterium]|nr:DUF2461 family protein [Nannocystaceae bacterium]
MPFEGFDPAALALLGELPTFDKTRFEAARETLARGIRRPGAALITELAEALEPALTVDPRGSISPLHRDLRFAKPGSARYKDHLLMTTWQGPDKKSAPMLWLRVDSESVGFASGFGFTPETRVRWREAVAETRGETLARCIAELQRKHRRHDIEVAGSSLKRVPSPWDDGHPREDLLRRTGFQVRFREPLPKLASTAAFATWCGKRLGDLMPVHRWLVSVLG